jgi:ABC-type phosphonate transport system ATPase subunit
MTATAVAGAATSGPVPALRVRGLRRMYGPVIAVDGVDLDVLPGRS